MYSLHFRRGLMALILLTLLFASPVLAQPRSQARPVRTAHPVVSVPQLSLLDFFMNTLSSLFSSSRSANSSTTTSGSGTTTSSGDGSGAGIRIDPDGRSTPAPTQPTTPSAGLG